MTKVTVGGGSSVHLRGTIKPGLEDVIEGTNVTIDKTDPKNPIISSTGGGGSMVYPGAGIALSTGSAWGTSITDNSSNWNTAYGWGDHASAGYLTGLTNGNGTTVNGTDGVDWGGTLTTDVFIDGNYGFNLGNTTPLVSTAISVDDRIEFNVNNANGSGYLVFIAGNPGDAGFHMEIGDSDYQHIFDVSNTGAILEQIDQISADVSTLYLHNTYSLLSFNSKRLKFETSGTTLDLGSDATGDTYYRNSSGYFTRLAAGTNGDVLTLASGIPSWAAPLTNHSGLSLDDGTNPHGTTKADVGLGNVDNTSDANKTISTATQTALDGKFTQRTITGTTNQITVTNGDGVSGNPTLSLPSAITTPGTLTTTGVLSPSADSTYTLGTSSLYWSNTYTDRLYLNSTAYLDGGTAGAVGITGNVGIGTTTPAAKLEVNGTFLTSGQAILADAYRFYSGGTDGSAQYTDFRTNPVTGNAIISAKSGAVFLNYDHGTNGTIFSDGSQNTVAGVLGGGTIGTLASNQFVWGAGGTGIQMNSFDTGLARLSAGVVKITNGSSGDGVLYAGGSGNNYFGGNVQVNQALLVGGTSLTNSSTLVDFQSTTKALIVPRVTNIASVTTPVAGMIAYDAATNKFNLRESSSWTQLATGNVVGPSSATDGAVAIYDGTTGKIIKNSLVTIDASGYLTANSFIQSATNTNKKSFVINYGTLGSSSAATSTIGTYGMYSNSTALIAHVTVTAIKTDGSASAHATVTARFRKDSGGTFYVDDTGIDTTSDITVLADVVGEISGTNPQIKVTMGAASGNWNVSFMAEVLEVKM